MTFLTTDENKTISFEVSIDGTDTSPEDIKLIFECGKSEISISGIAEEGKITFDIPAITKSDYPTSILEKEMVNSRLEMYVEDKRFVPWKGQFDIKKSVKINVNSLEENKKPKKKEIKASQPIVEEVIPKKKEIIEETKKEVVKKVKEIQLEDIKVNTNFGSHF